MRLLLSGGEPINGCYKSKHSKTTVVSEKRLRTSEKYVLSLDSGASWDKILPTLPPLLTK